jgi:hypothetical protein
VKCPTEDWTLADWAEVWAAYTEALDRAVDAHIALRDYDVRATRPRKRKRKRRRRSR